MTTMTADQLAPGRASFSAVLVGAIVAVDGRSDWYKGAQLTLVYTMIALLFYFLPAAAH